MEFHRLFSRDLIRIMGLVLLMGVALSGIGAFVSHTPVDPQTAQANDLSMEQFSERALVEGMDECLSSTSPGPPDLGGLPFVPSPDVEQEPEPTYRECRERLVMPRAFLGELRMLFAREFPAALDRMIFPFALMAFVAGASFIGAEWRAGTVGTILVWETRRLRLLVAKMVPLILVIAGSFYLTAALISLVLIPTALSSRGTLAATSALWWEHVFGLAARGVALAELAGLLGFAVAQLIRNTVAAVGVMFGWLVVLEGVLRRFTQALNGWLVSLNAVVLQQGYDLDVRTGRRRAIIGDRTPEEAFGLLAVYTLSLLLVTAFLFWRRDVHGSGE